MRFPVFLLAALVLVPAQGMCEQQVALSGYLEQLVRDGVRLIYSDDVVTSDLLITLPSNDADRIASLEQAITPLGLQLKRGPGGTLLIVASTAATVLPGKITGVIRSTSGVRLSNARVTAGSSSPSVSDGAGRYTLEKLAIGFHTLQVTAPGFSPASQVVIIDQAQVALRIDVALQPLPSALENIVVTASKHQLRFESAGAHTSIDAEQLKATPSVAGEPLRAAARLPGTATGGISARTHVRGGGDNETLYRIDGLRLYEPFHLQDFYSPASVINQSAIANIEFYAGGFPVQFGDRMSAVANVDLRHPDKHFEAQAELSIFNTSLVGLGTFADSRGEWLVSARRGNLDLALNALEQDFGNPSYGDVLLHAGWTLAPHTNLSANLLVSRDKIALRQRDSEVADGIYRNLYLWLRAQSRLSDRLQSDVVLSYSEIDSTRRGSVDIPGVASGSVDDERAFGILGLRQDWRWRAAPSLEVYAGGNIQRLDGSYRYSSRATAQPPFDQIEGTVPLESRSIAVSPDGNQYAIYAGARWQSPWAFVFDGGARWDAQTYTTNIDDEQVSPRLSALLATSANTSLRLTWGRYHQAQEINELQVDAGITTYLPAQRAEHAIVSFSYQPPHMPVWRAEVYQKDILAPQTRFENLFNPRVLLPELRTDRVRIDAESSIIRGLELQVSSAAEATPLSWWLNYTWSDAFDRVSNSRIRRNWDQTHALKAGLQWSRGAWVVNTAAELHTGWPRTTALLIPESDDGKPASLAVSQRGSTRQRPFHTLDLRVSRQFPFPGGAAEGFLQISNLTNRQNPCCSDYRLGEDALGNAILVEDRVHWLPILPSLGIILRF